MIAESPKGTHWNPELYHQYQDQRLRPALELLDRVPLAAPENIYDLGCGSGEVTAAIAVRWPDAAVTGIDSSPQMLERARIISSNIDWRKMTIQDWRPTRPPDLIYSNAALQWLDSHETLFIRLLDYLKPGGCLAVQMPLSWGAPSHRLMRELLAEGVAGAAPGDAALRSRLQRNWVEDADWYYDLLASRSCRLDIWETEYHQVLTGDDPVFEWVRATALRPVLEGLSDTELQRFIPRYKQRLREAYPRRADGKTLYPFRRLFIIAQV